MADGQICKEAKTIIKASLRSHDSSNYIKNLKASFDYKKFKKWREKQWWNK